jgi:hypothetical protein
MRSLLPRRCAPVACFKFWQYETGDSADLWIVGEDGFSTSALARRTKHRILDFEVFVSSPEDLIIQKLRWALMSGGSEKQINDVRGVYEL